MNQASFTISRKDIVEVFKKITRIIGRKSKFNIYTVLELTITDDLVTFVVPGIKIEQLCQTFKTAKVSLDFFYLKDIVESSKSKTIALKFYDNELQIDKLKISVQTTFFETDEILRSIKLPINYTHFHLLRLEHEGYTDEELIFNGLQYEINEAKAYLAHNIQQARTFIGVYGVTAKELEDLIQDRIMLKK